MRKQGFVGYKNKSTGFSLCFYYYFSASVVFSRLFLSKIQASIDFLLSSDVDYEFRTTVTNELHTPQDIVLISEWIKGAKLYFVQNFVDSGNILKNGQTPVSAATLDEMALCARRNLKNVGLR